MCRRCDVWLKMLQALKKPRQVTYIAFIPRRASGAHGIEKGWSVLRARAHLVFKK
jgi:hypothetical protein